MATTLSQLIAQSRLWRTELDNDIAFPSAAMIAYINTAEKYLCDRIHSVNPQMLQKVATLTVTPGQQYSNLPSDFRELVMLKWGDIIMQPVRNFTDIAINNTTSGGTPPFYFVEGQDKLWFSHNPQAAPSSLTLYYIHENAKMSNLSDQMALKDSWKELISKYAAITALQNYNFAVDGLYSQFSLELQASLDAMARQLYGDGGEINDFDRAFYGGL